MSERPVPKRCPKHLIDRPQLLRKLQAHGNGLRGHYGVPVYLVGSALEDDNADPRDWDIRLFLPPSHFVRRYGSVTDWIIEGGTGEWTRIRRRWSDDCVKQSQRVSEAAKMNIDFQALPWRIRGEFRGKPRMRLDTPLLELEPAT